MALGALISSTFVILTLSPLLIILSLFLLPFAVLTTVLAAFTLSIRVLAVYVELLAVILQKYFSRPRPVFIPAAPVKKSKSVRSVSSSSGSQTPKLQTIYPPSTPLTRDFEGVGGWRYGGDNEDSDDQWLTMNSRLELPAVASIVPEERHRKHHRSLTSGSQQAEKMNVRRGGTGSRPRSAVMSGTASPEYMPNSYGRVKSMVILGDASSNMNIGRSRDLKRRKSSSSSTSGSAKTLVLETTQAS